MDGWNHPNILISPLLFVKVIRLLHCLHSVCALIAPGSRSSLLLVFVPLRNYTLTHSRIRGPQVESLVSFGRCIRRGTRREGDGGADYLPPPVLITMMTTAAVPSSMRRRLNSLANFSKPSRSMLSSGCITQLIHCLSTTVHRRFIISVEMTICDQYQ